MTLFGVALGFGFMVLVKFFLLRTTFLHIEISDMTFLAINDGLFALLFWGGLILLVSKIIGTKHFKKESKNRFIAFLKQNLV